MIAIEKRNIRKRAKSILHTYMKDGDKNPKKYMFRAIRYIMNFN